MYMFICRYKTRGHTSVFCKPLQGLRRTVALVQGSERDERGREMWQPPPPCILIEFGTIALPENDCMLLQLLS
jgi:hypothetical protein